MRHILSVLLLLPVACVVEPSPARPDGLSEATVVYIDDGDTIDVQIDGRLERVRYIGIDAPEVPHHGQGGTRGGEAAAQLNRAMVDRRRIRLEVDVEPRDRYGRLLAYVWLGHTMVNLEMVRRGYARALTIPPNLRYASWFAGAEAEARATGRGLWGGSDLDGALPVDAPVIASPAPTVGRRGLAILMGDAAPEGGAAPHSRAIANPLLPHPAPITHPAVRAARARPAHAARAEQLRRAAHRSCAARRR